MIDIKDISNWHIAKDDDGKYYIGISTFDTGTGEKYTKQLFKGEFNYLNHIVLSFKKYKDKIEQLEKEQSIKEQSIKDITEKHDEIKDMAFDLLVENKDLNKKLFNATRENTLNKTKIIQLESENERLKNYDSQD